jgi:hypothetical protein
VRFTRHARQRLKLYRVTRDQAEAIADSGALTGEDARGNPRRTGAVEARTIVVVIALDNPDLIITLYERRA